MRKMEKDPDGLMGRVRDRIGALRKARGGQSVQNLADGLEPYGVRVSRSALANFESGWRDDITFREAVGLALLLDVEMVDLLTEVETPDEPVTVGTHTILTRELRLLLGSALSGQGADEGDALLVNRAHNGLERERAKRRLRGEDPGPPLTTYDATPAATEQARRIQRRRKT